MDVSGFSTCLLNQENNYYFLEKNLEIVKFGSDEKALLKALQTAFNSQSDSFLVSAPKTMSRACIEQTFFRVFFGEKIMARITIANAFSINMLNNTPITISFTEITEEAAQALVQNCDDVYSVVGHPDTASVFTSILKTPIEFNRENFTWTKGTLLVGQVIGRLPEGVKELPSNVKLKWFILSK